MLPRFKMWAASGASWLTSRYGRILIADVSARRAMRTQAGLRHHGRLMGTRRIRTPRAERVTTAIVVDSSLTRADRP